MSCEHYIAAARRRLAPFDPILRREFCPAPDARPAKAHKDPGQPLTGTQSRIMALLAAAEGAFVATHVIGELHSVANQIRWIRGKLGEQTIISNRGSGYRLSNAGLAAWRALNP